VANKKPPKLAPGLRPTAKLAVDIEKLLVWAYRDELSKLHSSSAEGIWDLINDASTLGVVATSGEGAAQRYDFGLPDADAQEIAAAVASLGDLIIDWDASREAIMGDLAPLLLQRDVLMVRPLRTAALVTMHAKMNSRPDWHEETPRPYMVPAIKGPHRPAIVGECRGANFYSTGSYCPLRWAPSPITIALVRAEYAAWHRGLCTLADTLSLDRYEALPPAAPAQPWDGGDAQAARQPRVYAVGERHGLKLPLKPSRPLTGAPPRRRRRGEVRQIAPDDETLDKGAKA
jgi:hypothetical protein